MKKLIFLFVIIGSFVYADSLRIGVGAGYKKPLMEILQNINMDIEPIFGNMKQISSQASAKDFDIIISDKGYLLDKSGLNFIKTDDIGSGILVLVSNKISDINKLEKAGKIAIPHPSKAIFGIAASQFLSNSKLKESLKDKIIEVATVPQAASYVISGDVDAAFINLTEAIAMDKKVKYIIRIDENLYSPIKITAGSLERCKTNELCEKFINALNSQNNVEILTKYGLR